MKNLITTSRLILRELSNIDDINFYELNNDTEVMKFTGDQPFKSIEEARHFLDSYSDYSTNGFGRWAVILKETSEFIGWCGIKKNSNQEIDLGFRFKSKFWNMGYATESSQGVLKYAFNTLKLKCIIARTATKNESSIRVLTKLGFVFWKTEDYDNLGLCHFYKIYNEKYN